MYPRGRESERERELERRERLAEKLEEGKPEK